jgi:hypothetical protein
MAAVWLTLPSLLAFVGVSLATDHPVDFWLHVNTGRLMWETGTLAGWDHFTCTIAGSEVVNQNWLAELATYGLYRIGGFELCQFAAASCYAAAIGLSVLLAWRRSGNAHAAAWAGLAGWALALSNFGIRPQAISTLLFAAELFVLWCSAGRWGTIAWIAVIQLIWANSHGAFVLGAMLPGIFLAAAISKHWGDGALRGALTDREVHTYLVCSLVAALAMFVNPQPSHTLDYVFNTSSLSLDRGIEEWLPTNFATLTGKAYFASLAGMLVLLGVSRRRLETVEWLLLATFLLLGAKAQRMVIWWAMIVPPIAAPRLAELLSRRRKPTAHDDEDDLAPWFVVAGLVLFILTTFPWTRSYNPLLPADRRIARGIHEPAGAVAYLRDSGYRGNVFAPVSWGAYLTCFLYPDVKVFNDSRIESFPDDVWNDYLQIGAAEGDWNAALQKYQIDLVVWSDRLSVELRAALRRSLAWREVYDDAECAIFRRRDKSSGDPARPSPVDAAAASVRPY